MGGSTLYHVIKAMYKKFPDLAIIHFDAHTDLRTDYEGEPLSHSTPIRKASSSYRKTYFHSASAPE